MRGMPEAAEMAMARPARKLQPRQKQLEAVTALANLDGGDGEVDQSARLREQYK